MDVNFQEQMISYLNETVFDPIYQEEVTELTVPESLPPVGQIADCSGYLCVGSKEVENGTVSVTGELKVCVLYRAEDGGTLQKTQTQIGFTVRKTLPESDTEQYVMYRGWIRHIDARLLGERRLLLRANIGSSFAAYCPTSTAVYVPQDAPKTLCLLQNTYEMMLPVCCGEKEFRMNEEAVLPETAVGISEVLKSSVSFRILESKTVGDKAVFKGNVLLHVLYASSAGTLHGYDAELPFSQYVELDTETEDGEVRIGMQLLSCEVETDGQEDSKRLLVGIQALAQTVVCANRKLTLYEDAYVTRGTLQTQWQEIGIRARLDTQSITVNGELTLPAESERVLDAAVYPDQPLVRRDGDTVRAILPVTANVLYTDKDGKIQGKETKGEIACESRIAPSAVCCAEGTVPEQPICLASFDTVTLRLTAQFRLDSYMGSRLQTVRSAVTEQTEKKDPSRPSLIARRAGRESVWEIAKQCGSTVEAICEANGLISESVQEGAVLLIPMQ